MRQGKTCQIPGKKEGKNAKTARDVNLSNVGHIGRFGHLLRNEQLSTKALCRKMKTEKTPASNNDCIDKALNYYAVRDMYAKSVQK